MRMGTFLESVRVGTLLNHLIEVGTLWNHLGEGGYSLELPQ